MLISTVFESRTEKEKRRFPFFNKDIGTVLLYTPIYHGRALSRRVYNIK